MICLCWLGIETPASSEQSAASSARPAAEYPSQALTAACRRQAKAIGKRLGRAFAVEVSPPFVVAGNMPAAQLKKYTRASVTLPAKAMWTSYFRTKPDKPITVLLFADEGSYRTSAKRLYGDNKVAYFGYYKPDKRVLVMNISTGTGTLVHELTHALVAYDFPDIPLWFNEGLASLHEQCMVTEDKIVGRVNWRLGGLLGALGRGKLRPLRDLIGKQDFYGPLLGLNYAQARYFCMYMQKRGLLRRFYTSTS